MRPGRLEVKRCNVIAIERARVPTNQTGLRSFLGWCNVYWRFVKGSAKIAASLNKKTGKNQPFEFETLTDTEYAVFVELRWRLVSLLVLTLPATIENIHWTPKPAASKWFAPCHRATRRRLSTDLVLESRAERRGAKLYDDRKRMLGSNVEHPQATAVPIRKRIKPQHGSRSPPMGPQYGG